EVCETEILGSGVGYVRGRVSTPVPPDSKSVLLNYDKFSFICGCVLKDKVIILGWINI
ncbi:hypothetical protein LINPERHAP1_LOCUS22290, partial [Linum perenne]